MKQALGKNPGRDLKAEILQTAEQMFIQYGYDGTTFQKISDALGITKGAITYHFKNKHLIILYIFQTFFEQTRAFIDQYPQEYRNAYWRISLTYIYVYRKIMGDPKIRPLFYHHEQIHQWQSGKVGTVYDLYKTIAQDFHKEFTHEELLLTTYMDMGARSRIYTEYADNPDLLSVDQFCFYHVYLIGLLSRLDEFTIRENIRAAFAFADAHPFHQTLFGR